MNDEDQGNRIIEMEFKAKEDAAKRAHELQMAKAERDGYSLDQLMLSIFLASLTVLVVSVLSMKLSHAKNELSKVDPSGSGRCVAWEK